MYKEDLEEKNCCCDHECHCGDGCTCGEDCHCHDADRCNENCTCENDKKNCGCHECSCEEEINYLSLAQRIQADFDNYRRHAIENINKARIDGQVSVIEAFLPCLDIFKEAKKSISDESVLKGVEMVENKIIETLKDLGVEKLNSIGEVYDPKIHNVIAVVRNEQQENDVIVDEYQAGYKLGDKIIRYAKVIVNKSGG